MKLDGVEHLSITRPGTVLSDIVDQRTLQSANHASSLRRDVVSVRYVNVE